MITEYMIIPAVRAKKAEVRIGDQVPRGSSGSKHETKPVAPPFSCAKSAYQATRNSGSWLHGRGQIPIAATSPLSPLPSSSKSAYQCESARPDWPAISFTSAQKGARTWLGKHVSTPALDKLTSGTGRFWKTTRTGTAVVTSWDSSESVERPLVQTPESDSTR